MNNIKWLISLWEGDGGGVEEDGGSIEYWAKFSSTNTDCIHVFSHKWTIEH